MNDFEQSLERRRNKAGLEVSNRFWTVPNVVSLSRVAAVPVVLWLLVGRSFAAAAGVMLWMAVSDFLDGKLARLLNQVSSIGVLLDPLADYLSRLLLIPVLMAVQLVPTSIGVALIVQGVLLAGGYAVVRRYGFGLPAASRWGKAGMFLFWVSVWALPVEELRLLALPLFVVSAALTYVAFFLYMWDLVTWFRLNQVFNVRPRG